MQPGTGKGHLSKKLERNVLVQEDKRFGRFLKIMYPLFYFAIYPMAIGIFAAEAIFNTNPS